MKVNTRQYTIRKVPLYVDQLLKRRAKEKSKSLNQVALEALMEGAGEKPYTRTDLDFLRGSLSRSEAKGVESVLKSQRIIDEELWK